MTRKGEPRVLRAERPGVIWCSNQRRGRSNGWTFPPNVEKKLRELTDGRRVLQLFGGAARWGVRLDVDEHVRPDVIGDAWLPPFRQDAFDVVILDPPYIAINQQMKTELLRAAQFVARESVVWFHTQWIASERGLQKGQTWLVRVGDSCSVRCLQVFHVRGPKQVWRPRFTRGPAMKYNRWLAGNVALPFQTEDPRSVQERLRR